MSEITRNYVMHVQPSSNRPGIVTCFNRRNGNGHYGQVWFATARSLLTYSRMKLAEISTEQIMFPDFLQTKVFLTNVEDARRRRRPFLVLTTDVRHSRRSYVSAIEEVMLLKTFKRDVELYNVRCFKQICNTVGIKLDEDLKEDLLFWLWYDEESHSVRISKSGVFINLDAFVADYTRCLQEMGINYAPMDTVLISNGFRVEHMPRQPIDICVGMNNMSIGGMPTNGPLNVVFAVNRKVGIKLDGQFMGIFDYFPLSTTEDLIYDISRQFNDTPLFEVTMERLQIKLPMPERYQYMAVAVGKPYREEHCRPAQLLQNFYFGIEETVVVTRW